MASLRTAVARMADRNLATEVSERTAALVRGACADLAAYRQVVGEIQALEVARAVLAAADKAHSEGDDDDG